MSASGLRQTQGRSVQTSFKECLSRYLALAVLLFSAACTDGPLEIDEQYYLRASDGNNVNYYRITVSAETRLSKAEFRQGWYPVDALDALFGDVSDEAASRELETLTTLKRQINETLIELRKLYNAELVKLDTEIEAYEKKLRRLLEAEARLRRFASRSPDSLAGDESIRFESADYDPAAPLITRRSGQRLVFILSADPDQIIQDIQRFAEDQKTQSVVQQLTDLLAATGRRELEARRGEAAASEEGDAKVAAQIDTLLAALGGDPSPSKARVLAELEALGLVIEQIQAGD